VSVAPLLAAALLAVAVLLPPEIHPAGRLAAHLLGAATALALAWGGWPLSPRARWCGLLLLPLPVASLLLASGGRARGLEEAAAFAAFGLAVLLGRRVAARGEPGRIPFPAVLAVLGTLAAAQAILQHHWAYPRAAAELRAAGPAEAEAYLGRLEQGRPAGPFSLPAALGGFLALALPMTLAVRRQAAGAAVRWGVTAALLTQGYALFLTRSLGGLLAATVALGIAASSSRPGRPWREAVAAAIAFAAIAGFFIHGRRAEIGARPGGDPVTLRLGNWEAAARMISGHPFLGVGPGRFPVFYPRFMRPGMNETQYAHNSYLQVAATWGAWTVLPLGLLAAAALRRRAARDGAGPAAYAAGAGFLVHNAVDFTFFLPGVALPAGLLLGFSSPPAQEETGAPASRHRGRDRMAGVLLAAAFLAYAATADRAVRHFDHARTLAVAGKPEEAERRALRAVSAWPLDPDPWAFVAQSLLARGAADPASVALLAEAAERAVTLEPEAAILHHTRALDRAAAADPAAAWIEEQRAAQLFPEKELYRSSLQDAGR